MSLAAEFKRQGEEFHKVCSIIDQPDIMFDITVVFGFDGCGQQKLHPPRQRPL